MSAVALLQPSQAQINPELMKKYNQTKIDIGTIETILEIGLKFFPNNDIFTNALRLITLLDLNGSDSQINIEAAELAKITGIEAQLLFYGNLEAFCKEKGVDLELLKKNISLQAQFLTAKKAVKVALQKFDENKHVAMTHGFLGNQSLASLAPTTDTSNLPKQNQALELANGMAMTALKSLIPTIEGRPQEENLAALKEALIELNQQS